MSELAQAIEEMRNMREIYGTLANGTITAPIVGELEEGKADIVAAINAMGGTATADMSMGELANSIRALILVQLGELEFNVPIASAQEAANKLQDHCTKYVDDSTEIMDTPLIVDEWQAVEVVRYKKLLDYNFTQFSSDERKTGIYCLTNCHNLRRIIFDLLRTITIDVSSQFAFGNLILLEEVTMPSLTSISINNTTGSDSSRILSGLSSLTSLSLPALTSINSSVTGQSQLNSSQILSGLSSLISLSLPNLTSIFCRCGNYGTNSAQILSGLSSLTSLYLPAITSISSSAATGGTNNAQILNGCVNLEYIEIGHTSIEGGSITGNMRLNINPTNIYENATKLAALNASIREHWFANLRDYTGGTAHAISLPTAFVQHMEQATKDVAAAKNWTIVTF